MPAMAYDTGNIFAKILRGETNAHVVLDAERCFAFMDLMPQSPGHTLIIPREPAENIFELSDEGLAELIATTRLVARAVRAAFNPAGVMIMQLNGADAGAKDRCGGGVEVDRRNPEAPCATSVAASRLWRRRRGGPEYRRLDGNHDLKGQIGMRKQRGDAGERREDL